MMEVIYHRKTLLNGRYNDRDGVILREKRVRDIMMVGAFGKRGVRGTMKRSYRKRKALKHFMEMNDGDKSFKDALKDSMGLKTWGYSTLKMR